jgi:predicted GIY-YIG superfamily endonuclease
MYPFTRYTKKLNKNTNPKDEIEIEVNESRMKKYTNFDEMFTYCTNHILHFCVRHKYIYIGATNNPMLRCEEHLNEKGMYKMKVLCEIQNKAQAAELETVLINHFKDYKKLVNIISIKKNGQLNLRGGVGLIEGINYIYVLFD